MKFKIDDIVNIIDYKSANSWKVIEVIGETRYQAEYNNWYVIGRPIDMPPNCIYHGMEIHGSRLKLDKSQLRDNKLSEIGI